MSPSNSTAPRRLQGSAPFLLGLLALTLAVYARAASCGFVNIDDTSYLTENPHVLGGLTGSGVRWAFTSLEMANWHPLTWLSHMADVQLYGLNPAGHHVTSVLLHAANVLLLFVLLHSCTGARWRSACVAALFAVHPLHVESVAWVSERKDVLCTLFLFAVLLSYRRYAESPAASRYAATLFLFLLGLMAKPMLVTLPFLLILFDWWPLVRYPGQASGRTLFAEKVPFFLLAAGSACVTLYAQKMGGAVATTAAVPLGARVANALVAYAAYLGKTFWPVRLAALYPFPAELPLWRVSLAVLLLAAVTSLALWQARPRPYLAVGWFWFLGTLVPVIGLVQVGGQAMADRYSYIPHIGLFIAVVWGGAELAGRCRRGVPFARGAILVILAALACCSWRQISYWRGGIELFEHTLACTEHNALGHYHLGVALSQRGRLNEALQQYALAAQIDPGFSLPHYGLGVNLMQLGELDRAIDEYRQGVALDPRNERILYNLGGALLKRGRLEEAVTCYREAVRLAPGDDNLRNNLGSALLTLGRRQEAFAEFSRALQINPGNQWARANLESIGR